jgi:tartrate-resistant acid phosphatase type 5
MTRVARWLIALLLVVCLASLAGCTPRATGTLPLQTVKPAPVSSQTATAAAIATPSADATFTFAVIGDYGDGSRNEAAVAKLVASWKPAFIITTGDDYYTPAGGTGTARYDKSTGAYYCAWLKDVSTTGSACRIGKATRNAFFPSLGNHDYSDARPSLSTYLTYFDLPGTGFTNTSGNERFYDFVEGPVHFFVLDSNSQEASGTSSTSAQSRWLEEQLAASTSKWNVVYDHHPPYSSDSTHGSSTYMRWPFAAWGADAVLSGHAHTYERLIRNGIPYFVNGLGGAARYDFKSPLPGSKVRYRASWGAQMVTVTSSAMEFRFYTVTGALKDSYRLTAP